MWSHGHTDMGTDRINRTESEVKEVKQRVQKTPKNRVNWAKFAGGGVLANSIFS